MADIRRPHYFTNQFLIERDFEDEQAYQLAMRRRHNALMHSWGVVQGFEVARVADDRVSIGPGAAIDSAGREIVLEAAQVHQLQNRGSNVDVFLTIAYAEELSDPLTENGVTDFTRAIERPVVADSQSAPPADGSGILLARIRCNASGAIDTGAGGIDPGVRTLSSAQIAPGAITTSELADNAVTLPKLAHAATPITVQSSNTITATLDDAQRRVTIGESHSARTNNPHGVTAAQIDSPPAADLHQIVAQINAGTGLILRARIAPAPVLMVTGVVTFQNMLLELDQFSDEIDPNLGTGPLCILLAAEDTATSLLSGDSLLSHPIKYRAELNRLTGRFRIFAARTAAPVGVGKVRWFAFRPVPPPAT